MYSISIVFVKLFRGKCHINLLTASIGQIRPYKNQESSNHKLTKAVEIIQSQCSQFRVIYELHIYFKDISFKHNFFSIVQSQAVFVKNIDSAFQMKICKNNNKKKMLLSKMSV